jgi:hypothetical protein
VTSRQGTGKGLNLFYSVEEEAVMIYCTGCLSVGCSTVSSPIPSAVWDEDLLFLNGEVHIDVLLAVSIEEIVQRPPPDSGRRRES